ncbi:hypothetical protein CsSME_00053615 [Camellia sinensis var. sinensis]
MVIFKEKFSTGLYAHPYGILVQPRANIVTLNDDVDPASRLVARYNGFEESSEIIRWISQIIEDGDSRELPFFVS